MSEFTTTELVLISLVLNQNAEQYGESERFVRETARKARELSQEQANE